jgi:hypothetical protein
VETAIGYKDAVLDKELVRNVPNSVRDYPLLISELRCDRERAR